MIKRIIFDIDGVLIPWKDEYYIEINNTLDSLQIEYTNQDIKDIKKAMAEYENEYYTFNEKLMIDFINKYTNKNYPIQFINELLERWKNAIPQNTSLETIETLEYLSKKYELVILTDWFADEQIGRLNRMGILKYFSKVYTAEKVKRKPFKEAFIQAMDTYKPEECIMIGDSLERDIQGALNAKIKPIHINNNFDQNSSNYTTITSVKELIDIL